MTLFTIFSWSRKIEQEHAKRNSTNNAATRNQKENKIIIFNKIEHMSTILKIDTRSKAAKSFLAYAKTLSFVQIEEEGNSDKAFVTKIKQAEKEKGEKMTSAKTLWESL